MAAARQIRTRSVVPSVLCCATSPPAARRRNRAQDRRQGAFVRIVGTYIGTSFAAMIFTPYDYMAKVTNRIGETDALMVSVDQHESS